MATPARSPLGDCLRRHRLAAGLSQSALAEAAGLSLRGVSDIERGLKARPHPATMRMLADALGLDEARRTELAALSRPSRQATVPGPSVTPRASSMVGREAERTALRRLAGDPAVRLVTITGPGGVGKTRLALDLVESDPERFVFLDLSPLPPGSTVVATVASRLGIRDDGDRPLLELVRDDLARHPRTLVLDNCEHVIADVRQTVVALLAAPGVRIVATSRGPVRLSTERVLPLAPFSVPVAGSPPGDIAGADAVRLLVDRAREAHPGFDVSAGNAAALRTICEQVDGLPLAIELAAGRLRTLSPASLAALLDQRLRVLTAGPGDVPPRHQSLRATIAWSYDLLAGDRQAMFRRLAAFAGGFTLETASVVAGDGDPFATIDRLDSLADQGLIAADGDGRFRMLQAVREFAHGLLQESGEETVVRGAHAAVMLDFAGEMSDAIQGSQAATWLARGVAEEANLLAALDWLLVRAAAGDDATRPLVLAMRLWPWWHLQGRHRECQHWLDRALAFGDRVDPAIRAAVYLDLANTANNLEQHGRARTLYEETRRIGQETGDEAIVARAAIGLGLVAIAEGEYARAGEALATAMRHIDAADFAALRVPATYALGRLAAASGRYDDACHAFSNLATLVDPDDAGTLAYVRLELAQVRRLQGWLPEAEALVRSCRDTFQAFGERRALATCEVELGYLALARDEPAAALGAFASAATASAAIHDEYGLVRAFEGLAILTNHQADVDKAAVLFATAAAWRARTGTACALWERDAQRALEALPALIPAPSLAETLSSLELDTGPA